MEHVESFEYVFDDGPASGVTLLMVAMAGGYAVLADALLRFILRIPPAKRKAAKLPGRPGSRGQRSAVTVLISVDHRPPA